MDEIKQYIIQFSKGCDIELIHKLRNDLTRQEFDTNAVNMDMNLKSSSHNQLYDGNINIDTYGETICHLVKTFVEAQNSLVLRKLFQSFSVIATFTFYVCHSRERKYFSKFLFNRDMFLLLAQV